MMIFDNLQKYKLFRIIKYNKKMQSILNLTINDYKNFQKIEIEITPVKYEFGEFINGNNEYYHIYFNNDEQEIKRNYLTKSDEVSKIKIIIDSQVESFEKLFEFCKTTKSINFKKFYRTNIINIKNMFYGCSSLEELNYLEFNSNNVTNMGYMFAGCSSLVKLNLNCFTNKVTDMSYMFYRCSSLKELNISHFKTNNVNKMSFMFGNCSSLKVLNLSNFNTNNVLYMNSMFSNCSSLKELNIYSFNTNKIIYMGYMFSNCSSLKQLNISYDFSNYDNDFKTKNMLIGCTFELKRKTENKKRI